MIKLFLSILFLLVFTNRLMETPTIISNTFWSPSGEVFFVFEFRVNHGKNFIKRFQ